MLRLKGTLCLLQAMLMVVSSFSVYDSNFKLWVDRAAIALTSVRDFSFEPIEAKRLAVSEGEKKRCRDWFDANIRTAENPAYDFTVGGKRLRRHLADWDISVGEESAEGAVRPGGKTTVVTLVHRKIGLRASVEATIYEAYATCEWTVFIENGGASSSPVVSRFYAADCTLGTGRSELYVSQGSDPAANDFELLKTLVSPTPMVFNANGGRSESFLPYFNVSGPSCGFVAAVGWTGQWYASLRQTLTGVEFRAKQEFFRASLEPGQRIRSPLVSLTFYEDANAVKGFETFRGWQSGCAAPAGARPMKGYVIANEFNTMTCDELIAHLDRIDPGVMAATDYFWMDAGWYEYDESWYDGVGNWIPNAGRFPDTLRPLSDAMAARGKRFLLWYEPERVREGTALYEEGQKKPGRIIRIGDNLMWNLADDEACDILIEKIASSLAGNGVGVYRQDFNFTPLEYWRKADKELYGGRTGVCENAYVTNLYRYLDALRERVPGLLIDNCASGGKRLDIEMSRRSVPFWRSDYNCGSEDGSVKPDVLEATQSMTYGLSCWLPYSGTNQYYHSRYAIRSAILTHHSVYEPDPAQYVAYDDVREVMTKHYFPLRYGGTDAKKTLAMQFGDEKTGAALVYLREQAPERSFRLVLSGLEPGAVYTLTDADDLFEPVEATGERLMTEGLLLRFPEAPYAAVVRYRAAE